MTDSPVAQRGLVSWETERLVVDFLLGEAELLDSMRFDDWLGVLAPDIRYRVPVRTTRPPGQDSEFSTVAHHFDDDLSILRMRVARLNTGDAWAEVPPSRTRHFLTNFRVRPDTEHAAEFHVTSNLLLTRTRGDEATWEMLAGARHDRVRPRTAGGFELAERTVLLDTTTLTTYNLAFFL
ncbi:aromatic-ring-hydroxylating dioxygenase subunit beta [Pseudonocardia benzenivorans]|uniref:Aromatic-ring-hydroxylating dioxygenase subunit beta n=1 Tax=Pseudonocardia benzenivorans TaxID=228005 RepID=A0ABW3VUM6_9PSEU